ncbi:MAG: glycosyltransferase [Gemmatimonadota bacterium]
MLPDHPSVIYLGRNLHVGGAERVFVQYLNHAETLDPIGALLDASGPLADELSDGRAIYDLALGSAPMAPGRGQATGAAVRAAQWRILVEAWHLRDVVRATGASLVSSFLLRAHIVAYLTKRLWCPDLQLVFNVHSMMIQSERYLFPDPVSRRIMRDFVRHVFPTAGAVITVADGVADELRAHAPLREERLHVIPNAIDAEHIRRQSTKGPTVDDGGRPVVVGVGRMERLKGFDLLLEAVARMDPRARPTVVLVGDGPEKTELEQLGARLGLSDRLHMVGQVQNPWGYMAQATVVAVPSRTEAFPNVIGEALALGVPVVAADCAPGVREYLHGGACGVLVPPDDAPALGAALSRLFGDPDRRGALRDTGLSRVAELSVGRTVRAYEDVLLGAVHG